MNVLTGTGGQFSDYLGNAKCKYAIYLWLENSILFIIHSSYKKGACSLRARSCDQL